MYFNRFFSLKNTVTFLQERRLSKRLVQRLQHELHQRSNYFRNLFHDLWTLQKVLALDPGQISVQQTYWASKKGFAQLVQCKKFKLCRAFLEMIMKINYNKKNDVIAKNVEQSPISIVFIYTSTSTQKVLLSFFSCRYTHWWSMLMMRFYWIMLYFSA